MPAADEQGGKRPLHIGLWVLQLILAALFVAAGTAKFLVAPEQGAEGMGWEGSILFIRIIGTAELLGALGLVLPSMTRVQTRLTPIAAGSLTVVMLLAAGVHLGRDEYAEMAPPLVLAGLLLVVAWGRAASATIEPRGSTRPPGETITRRG